MKMLSLKLPDGLHGKLERLAKRRGQSKSELVRLALDQFLMSTNGKTQPISVLELAGDLIGCAQGPEDLSTNPRYMEGYGE